MANFAENKMAFASCCDHCSENDMVRSNQTANIIAIIADIRVLVSVFVVVIAIITILGLGISVLLLAGLLISLLIISVILQPPKKRIALM